MAEGPAQADMEPIKRNEPKFVKGDEVRPTRSYFTDRMRLSRTESAGKTSCLCPMPSRFGGGTSESLASPTGFEPVLPP